MSRAIATRAPGGPRRRRRVRLVVLLPVLLLVVVLGVVASAAIYLGSLASTYDSMRHTAADSQVFPQTARPTPATAQAAKAQNILLVGVDTGAAAPTSVAQLSGAATEVLVLLHVPADGKHVYAVSMRRDLRVAIPGHGTGELASAITTGGLPLAVQTVETLTKTRVDHVAVVSYAGFGGLTNALGSVTVSNPTAFSAPGDEFGQGQVTLTGAQALAYIRGARSSGLSEAQQVQTQQAYLRAVLAKILSAGTLLNPVRLHDTVAAISPYLLVDQDLDSVYLANLTLELRSLRGSDLEFLTFPTTDTAGQAVPDRLKGAQLMQDLSHDTMGEYAG